MRYSFANCVLDSGSHKLTRSGKSVEVEPQVFDILQLLLDRAGQLVTKDDLIAEIWNGRIVSESAISARIAAARKAVGDDGKSQTIIRTVARRGVRLATSVTHHGVANPTEPTQAAAIKFAKTHDSTQIAYSVTGTGPPLFRMAHQPSNIEKEPGNALDWLSFAALAERHSLIRADYRGCGLSERQLRHPIIPNAAEDILAVADALELEKFAVLGQSSGAMIAIQLAAKHPDRISHLVLQAGYVDGRSLRGNADPAENDIMRRLVGEGWDNERSPFVSAYINLYFPDAPREFLSACAEELSGSATTEAVLAFRDATNTHSVADLLDKVIAPTLVIHSRHDAVHPLSEAQKMAGGLADAELVVLDSANHYVLHHEPCGQDHLDAIFRFLGTAD